MFEDDLPDEEEKDDGGEIVQDGESNEQIQQRLTELKDLIKTATTMDQMRALTEEQSLLMDKLIENQNRRMSCIYSIHLRSNN